MKSYFSVILLCGILSMVSGAEIHSRRRLKDDELGSSILATIMGGSNRLTVQNKTAQLTLTPASASPSPDSDALEIVGHPNGHIEVASRAKQDAIINRLWGGDCKLDDWHRCHNITTWGGDYTYKDKEEHFEMECTTFRSVCMRNGWTVNRCHLLCMGICNRDLLITRSYDRYVSHDGNCEPLSKKI